MGKYRKNNWRKRTKKKSIFGTKAQFMPKELAVERYNNLSTKTFYFKAAGSINSSALVPGPPPVFGNSKNVWPTQFNIGTQPTMPVIADSLIVANAYTEYKVLAVKVKVFAANIGTEPGIEVAGPDIPGFNRGNTIMFIDQDTIYNENYDADILNNMTRGSCKMIPSRCDQYSRIMYRKKGVPGWGCCDQNIAPADRKPDPWAGAIVLIGNNARASVRPLWYFTVSYKIMFRGRNQTN